MIRFQCPHCAQKLTVPDGQAGRAGQCPGCKSRITIPPTIISEELLATGPSPADADRARALQKGQGESAAATSDALDRRLLDLPPTGSAEGAQVRLSDEEVLAKLKFKPPPEHAGERRLPWPIDILLYPANTAGLTSLAIIVGVPFLLTLVQLLVFLPFLGLPLSIAKLVVALYAAWYWAECTYDSARGGTRAPGVFDTAGLGDMWSRVSYLLAVYIIFVLPTVLYPLYGGRNAAVFSVLLAWAVIFFPMGLLAMVINDGTYVLNPFFLLGSIRRTFIPYLGLLLLITTQGLLFRLIPNLLMRGGHSIGWVGLGSLTAAYSSLVTAHILGCFYWRYGDRLDWGE
jgi:DNA-directed RNA polymerase subunit RPC12/RpoP